MDVRIGVTQVAREMLVELADDADRDDLKGADRRGPGGRHGPCGSPTAGAARSPCPSAKIAYVELGTADGDRRIGFGG